MELSTEDGPFSPQATTLRMATVSQTNSTAPTADDLKTRLARLPEYARSLLKIDVSLAACVSSKKMPLAAVLDLAPGTLLQFEKRFDEPIQLMIGDHPIAEGEAVKVGDRFGLRISSIVLPSERFERVRVGEQKTHQDEPAPETAEIAADEVPEQTTAAEA